MSKRNETIYRGVKHPDRLIHLVFGNCKFVPVWLGKDYPRDILESMASYGVVVMSLEDDSLKFYPNRGYFKVGNTKYYDIEAARAAI